MTEGFRPSSTPDESATAPTDATLDDPLADRIIEDPYAPDPALHPAESAPRGGMSVLAVTSVAALPLGPAGPVASILFGWAARREIERSGARLRGYTLATIGMALGAVMTMAWGAALSTWAWAHRYGEDIVTERGDDTPAVARPGERSRGPRGAPAPSPAPGPAEAPAKILGEGVPKTTQSKREGAIGVIDVGISVTSLSEELAKQRAEAAKMGETLLLMTTASRCDPCRGVDRALADPLLQTALARIRLVRVDVEVFHEDLELLKVPHEAIPGFFLLSPDLTPRDGINGGEWDADIAPNIAPVLGAFVRGRYGARKKAWAPLPGSGMRL